MKKILSVLLFCVSILSFAQEKVLLRVNYKKGDVYLTDVKTSVVMGDKMNTDMNIDMVMEVLDIENNVYNIKTTFPRVRMKMSVSGRFVDYDSNQKVEDMDEMAKTMHAKMSPMTKAIVNLKMDKRGNILSSKVIEGADEYSYTDNGSTISYPEAPVEIGTTWTSRREASGFPVTYNYKVISIDKEKVEVEMKGIMDGVEAAEIKGNCFVDIKTGSLDPMNINIVMEMFGQKMITKGMSSTKKKI